MREEDIQCYQCPNQCLATMVVSEQGLVTQAWRNVPAHNRLEKRHCKQLDNVIGKNIDNARKAIQKRIPPYRVTIGH